MASCCRLMSVLVAFSILSLFHNPITVTGQNIPEAALFTFGDSNFDAGNKILLTNTNQPQSFWPYGKSNDFPSGKFSDGRIVPDFIATFIGIPYEIPPALNTNANFERGASFAIEGAALLGSQGGYMTLKEQVSKFEELKSANWKTDFIKQSVFVIYVGANDYLNYTKYNPTADHSAHQAFVPSVINQLKNDINSLYSKGARKFVIQNLAPLGCLPIARQDYGTGMDQCHEPLNDLAKLHNEKIGPMMNDMARANPGFQFTVFDFYNSIIRRTQRKTNYRFAETNVSCCGVGTHNAYGCGFANVHSKLCEYQRSYLFFDGRHNTEKAQESFAHLLFGADPSVIQPMNVRELVVYPVDEPMREAWVAPETTTVQATESSSSSSRGYEY